MRKFPLEGTPEFENIKSRVESGESAESIVRGYPFVATVVRNYARQYGWVRGVKYETQLPQPDEVIIPEIKLRDYKPRKVRRGDEETAVLQLTDGHAGKITKSYDETVYQERMKNLFEATMTIIALHRHMYPINTLRIIALGDNVQGENPFQGSKVGTIKMGVRDQIAKLACPSLVQLICSLKQEFAEVTFDGFPGNHGADKFAPETSRADLSLYDLLEANIGDKKGITINIHEDWADVIDIMGWRYFCFHGDGVPCLVPSTRVLRADLCWIPIADVEVGDALVGFTENVPYNRNISHRLQHSNVLGKKTKRGQLYKIETDKGSVIASDNHLWLAAQSGWGWHRYDWVRTDNLASHYIKYLGDPWTNADNYKLGYLGGLFDGEGCVHRRPEECSVGIVLYQKPGTVWDYATGLLNKLRFTGNTATSSRGLNKWECYGYQAMKILGSTRPKRLLAQADCLWDNKNIRASERAKVLSVTAVGEGELIDIETSTNTFIAEGMYTHNCQQGVPFFALDRKLKSWHMQFGGFDVALGGHFHKRHTDEVSSRFEYLMGSTLVSDDEWALKKLGISSSPSQNILGVHPKQRVTWRYALKVDRKDMP